MENFCAKTSEPLSTWSSTMSAETVSASRMRSPANSSQRGLVAVQGEEEAIVALTILSILVHVWGRL